MSKPWLWLATVIVLVAGCSSDAEEPVRRAEPPAVTFTTTSEAMPVTTTTQIEVAPPTTAEPQPDPANSVTVFLYPTVGKRGQEIMVKMLDAIDGSYKFVDQEHTFVEFTEFFDSGPEVDGYTVEDMPPSFRLSPISPLDEELLATLEAHPAVRSVSTLETAVQYSNDLLSQARDPRSKLTIVYLLPDAGDEGRAEVNAILEDIPGFYFVDQKDTLEEFIVFFEGDDDVDLSLFEASTMPPSWRVDLDGTELPADLVAELEASRFVRTITNAVR